MATQPAVSIDGKKQSSDDAKYLWDEFFKGHEVGYRAFVDLPTVNKVYGYQELTEYEIKEQTDTECKLTKRSTRHDGGLAFRRNQDGTWDFVGSDSVGMPQQLYTVYTTGPKIPNPKKEHMTHDEFVAWYGQLAPEGYTARIENFLNEAMRLQGKNLSKADE